MEQKEVNYKDCEYVVLGDFDDGPPRTFWITKVSLLDGIDVSEHLTTEDYAALQEIILNEYGE